MSKPFPAVMADTSFVKVVPEILSDNSVAWNVTYETVDGDVIEFDCVDERHAEALAGELRKTSSVQVDVGVPS